jgi:hypothetical protein
MQDISISILRYVYLYIIPLHMSGRRSMAFEKRRVVAALAVFVTFCSVLIVGTAPYANADNVNKNVNSITMDVGTPNTELKVKIVANTAQNPAGDNQDGCNASDGTPAYVHLHISPAEGLTASPNPIIFDKCGNPPKTVTLTGTIGGTYEITATVEDAGSSPPGDPGYGVYHTEPFGTVTVVVVDGTPPETTIDSGPANPTASQTAVFAFSANEASTFECSLDGITYTSCTNPTTYNDLAKGTYTFYVRATDLSGNTDPTPASYSWEIGTLSITVVASPTNALWGVPISVEGTADVLDVPGLSVTLDWGDGETESGLAITNGEWSADPHTYFTSGPIIIRANLTDGTTVMATATALVEMEKHDTAIFFTSPASKEVVTGNTKLLIGGNLTDLDAGGGVDGATIEFSGVGTPDATTQGITFTGELTLSPCPLSRCTIDGDALGFDPDASDNMVLYANVGSEMTFPTTTTSALIYVQDTSEEIEFRVMEYGGIQQDCHSDPGIQDCVLGVADDGETGLIAPTSGFTSVGGVVVYNGIEKIIITKVGGSTVDGNVGISAIVTKNEDSSSSVQHVANYETLAAGSKASPFTVNAGAFFAYAIAQSTEATNLELEADFDGNDLYNPSDASVFYDVATDRDPVQQGVGGAADDLGSGTGTTQTARACTGSCDPDFDAIPNVEESQGFVDDSIVASGMKWFLPEAASTSQPDIYWEVDCMSGVTCLTQAQADYIEDRYSLRGIKLHIDLDDTGICSAFGVQKPVVAWSDAEAETITDLVVAANECNDFKSIKLNFFGTPTERNNNTPAVSGDDGTLGTGKGDLKLKHLVSRYMLIAYNTSGDGVNTCGSTGIAEYIGNDAIISVQCLLDKFNPASKPQVILGTVMHEMGHAHGLKHGGTDAINCKVNYISVMNYVRQVPTTDMVVMGNDVSTNYGWYGDYSHGPLLYQSAAGVNVDGVNGRTIGEASLTDNNKLVVSGTLSNWKAANGVELNSQGLATVTKFKVLWSDTTQGAVLPIKSGYAATTFGTSTAINWNGITGLTANPPGQDTNFLTVTVGNNQLPACTQASELTNIVSPQDDYVTMKSNLDEAFNQSTDLLGLSQSGLQDPDHDPEMNIETLEALNSAIFQSPGVQPPLNNVGFGDPGLSKIKKGSTVNVKFDLFDQDGNLVDGTNALSVYNIERMDLVIAQITSGTPPDDGAYFSPSTSTQPGFADHFTFDGSKWSFSFGTKNLQLNGEYAARIVIKFDTGELLVLDNKNDSVDNISFIFKIVK